MIMMFAEIRYEEVLLIVTIVAMCLWSIWYWSKW